MENHTDNLIAGFKALADPVRLRLVALCARGECSVSELAEVLALSQPRVSQHLRQLCEAGLLRRFRDGHFVYYRVPLGGRQPAHGRGLLGLLPAEEPQFERDFDRLRSLRSAAGAPRPAADASALRPLHRALIELTVSAPLGDVIDIGCGQGTLLKLLASRSRRAVGVDIDADARQLARAELLLAGIDNCSLRQGDMYALPFGDESFDTVILDDVVRTAAQPEAALAEASRLLKPAGRLLVVARAGEDEVGDFVTRLAGWCADTGLRLAAPRRAGEWLLAVATLAGPQTAAA